MIVWLASYPRSGNTLLRIVLNSVFDLKTYSIYDDRGDIGADPKTSAMVGHQDLPEDFDVEIANQSTDLYLIKTHDYPRNSTDKAIYLVRDGRSSVYSYFQHQKKYGNPNATLSDTIFVRSKFGLWSRHLEVWNPKERENTLFIKFEDLVADPLSFASQLANFLGVEQKSDHVPTFEELKKLNPGFFRSGSNEAWRDGFSLRDAIAFQTLNGELQKEFGYEYATDTTDTAETDTAVWLFAREIVVGLNESIRGQEKASSNLNRRISQVIEKTNARLNNVFANFEKVRKNQVETKKLVREIYRQQVEHPNREQEIGRLKQKLKVLQNRLAESQRALEKIHKSRSYRFVTTLAKLFRFGRDG